MPHGGQFLGGSIDEASVKAIDFWMKVLGAGGAVGFALAIVKRMKPAFRRYNDAAREVVNDVVTELHLPDQIRQKMLDMITSELSPCTDPS